MKRIAVLFLLLAGLSSFASEFGDLLKEAERQYDAGSVQEAQKILSAAQLLLSSEKAAESEYEEITRWKVVELKADQYLGKKVKVRAEFWWLNSDNFLVHIRNSDENFDVKFPSELVDVVLVLEKDKEYTFFGTVKNKYESSFLKGTCLYLDSVVEK